MTEQENKAPEAAGQKQEGKFSIHKIYVKDISFEAPNSPGIFQEQKQPSVNLDLSSGARGVDKNYYEVVLTVTVTMTSDDKTVYLVEVQQAGIFYLEGFPDAMVERMLATMCPNILFPFARELVADMVTRGGFSQLLLAPVNFEALYQQQQREKQKTKH